MKLVFDKEDVFTYSAKDLSVGIHSGKNGYVQDFEIQFANRGQVFHFKEMLEFILEKLEGDPV